MLHLTYTRMKRTRWVVIVCVLAVHVLALSALLLASRTPALQTPHSVALEMVLTPERDLPQTPVARAQPALPALPPKSAMAPPVAPPVAPPLARSIPTSAPSLPIPAAATPTTPTAPTSPTTPSATTAALATPSSPARPALTLPSSQGQGLNNPTPVYPPTSRRLNEQGHVVIRVWVGLDGAPQQGEIKTSSGYDRLDQEALRTVLRWRFIPGQRLGVPEAMWFNVPVNFVLE